MSEGLGLVAFRQEGDRLVAEVGKGGGYVAHQASVEDEGRADACRQPGTDDQKERDRSIVRVFGCGPHPSPPLASADTGRLSSYLRSSVRLLYAQRPGDTADAPMWSESALLWSTFFPHAPLLGLVV